VHNLAVFVDGVGEGDVGVGFKADILDDDILIGEVADGFQLLNG